MQAVRAETSDLSLEELESFRNAVRNDPNSTIIDRFAISDEALQLAALDDIEDFARESRARQELALEENEGRRLIEIQEELERLEQKLRTASPDEIEAIISQIQQLSSELSRFGGSVGGGGGTAAVGAGTGNEILSVTPTATNTLGVSQLSGSPAVANGVSLTPVDASSTSSAQNVSAVISVGFNDQNLSQSIQLGLNNIEQSPAIADNSTPVDSAVESDAPSNVGERPSDIANAPNGEDRTGDDVLNVNSDLLLLAQQAYTLENQQDEQSLAEFFEEGDEILRSAIEELENKLNRLLEEAENSRQLRDGENTEQP